MREMYYSEQYRTCGKKRCHCQQGERHGPYLYGYYRGADGKVKSIYYGRVQEAA